MISWSHRFQLAYEIRKFYPVRAIQTQGWELYEHLTRHFLDGNPPSLPKSSFDGSHRSRWGHGQVRANAVPFVLVVEHVDPFVIPR
jgi:hypothetical protein